jgi:hypothetical protein
MQVQLCGYPALSWRSAVRVYVPVLSVFTSFVPTRAPRLQVLPWCCKALTSIQCLQVLKNKLFAKCVTVFGSIGLAAAAACSTDTVPG